MTLLHTEGWLELAGCTQGLDPTRDIQICENAQKFHEPAVHSSGFSSLLSPKPSRVWGPWLPLVSDTSKGVQKNTEFWVWGLADLPIHLSGLSRSIFFGRDLSSDETSIVFNRPGVIQDWASSEWCWDYKLEWAKTLLFLQNFPFEMTGIKKYPCRSDVIP